MSTQSTTDGVAPRRPRGRQFTFDRDKALQTALELFWRHGYEGVSLSDLVLAIGIAPPSLYNAFGNKADLYRAVLRRYGAEGMSPQEVDAAPSALEAAQRMLERGVAAVTRPGGPLGCMVSNGMLMTGAENHDLAAELRDMRATLREALRARIERDVANGVLPAGTDAGTLARFVASVLQGLSVQALDGASAQELLSVAATALKAWPAGHSA
ncbi:TetR/AcrR family transcriptional regulator [Pseudoroseomonas wenyumeiae]